MSFGEACVSTAAGFTINFVLQLALYPLFGFHPSLRQNFSISMIFTLVSVGRGWLVRRLFNWVDNRDA